MKGVPDIFISKEKLAIFWYLASLGCLVFTGWHLHGMAVERRGTMLFVPIEESPFYLDRDLTADSRNELLDYHVRLALETYLNRGPMGPLTPDRLQYLFTGKGLEQVIFDEKETRYDFRNQQIHQLMEVGEIRLEVDTDLSARTIIQGQLLRVSIDPSTKEVVNQAFRVGADMHWVRNENLRTSRRFAWVCDDVSYELSEIRAETEKEEKN